MNVRLGAPPPGAMTIPMAPLPDRRRARRRSGGRPRGDDAIGNTTKVLLRTPRPAVVIRNEIGGISFAIMIAWIWETSELTQSRTAHNHLESHESGGSDASRPTARPLGFSLAEFKSIGLRLFNSIGEEHLTLIAAGVSFYAMLALVPTMIALISFYGFVADPADMERLLALLEPLVPQIAYELLQAQLASLAEKSDTTFKITSVGGALLAVWSAKAGVNALLTGLNVANRERDDRSFLKAMLLSYALTLGLILVMSITLAAIVIIPMVVSLIPDGDWQTRLVLWLRWPIAVAAVVVSLGILYRLGPSRRGAKVRWLSPGSVLATAVWILTSAALSFYVSTFGTYQATYGALGAVVVLMLWFWLSTLIILVGARLNAEMEYETRFDTTTGPQRPMGHRGAFVADHVASEHEEGDQRGDPRQGG